MNLDQLEKKKAELIGDIAILERQKESATSSLNQLQETKQKEFQLHDSEITIKKKNLRDVTQLLAEKRKEYDVLGAKHIELQKEVITYNKEELAKAEARRDRMLSVASDVLKEANEKWDEVGLLECEVVELCEALEILDETITQEKAQLSKKEAELHTLQKETDENVRLSKDVIASNTKILDNLLRDVKDQSEIKAKLDESVEKAIDFMKKTKRDATSILLEAKRLKIISQKEREANEKTAQKLAIEKRRLDDRAETLGRAYRETIHRGGAINAV